MTKKLTLLTLVLLLVLVLLAGMANADITTDLMGYWKLDGNANDSSGNNYHGEEFGNPSYVPGFIGQALDCDGPEQSVYISDITAIVGLEEVTVCMWAKPDHFTAGEDQVMWFVDQGGEYGRVRFGINGDEWEWRHGSSSDNISGQNVDCDDNGDNLVVGEWSHLVGTRKNNDKIELFVNAKSAEQKAFGVAGIAESQTSIGAERRSPTSVRTPFDGVIDEVRVYTRVLSAADIQELFMFAGELPTAASYPDPPDGQTDVPRDVVLSWKPGLFANTHNVYFGTVFSDVNDGIGGITQSAGSYAPPQRLDFSTTYYWRVDEVGGPPDFTVYQGAVWSFTTEPVAYTIMNVTATASSSDEEGRGPENTVNGSGLDESGLLHGNLGEGNMWLSGMTGQQPTWIEFEFDKVHKLHEMWVWNSNESLEKMIGVGFKDVTIEYSPDGIEYATLGTTHEFAQAPGALGYAHNTTIDLSSVVAKFVRLTANSNWGGFFPQYGLSEVRFFYIPVQAREPDPDSGATDVDLDVVLGFRAGRDAAKHDVYISSDEQAVIDGNAPVTTITETSYDPLTIDLGTTYYWRVDEVNDAETPANWQGDIWSFSTQEFLVVDDFEDYNEFEPFTIYNTWTDGYQNATNGSTIGYILGNPQETEIVHGGEQSVPVMYDNSAASFSEVSVSTDALAIGRDWTKGGAKTLALWFYGDPANAVTEQMYVKINGSKVLYNGDAADIGKPGWKHWNIELAALGIDPGNVTQLSIGFERTGASGGSGTVLIDDIRLYPYSPELITPAEPNNAALLVHLAFDEGFGNTAGDSSGNGRDGVISGATWQPGGYDGTAQCLDFGGDGDHVINPDASYLNGLNAVTFCVWVKSDLTNTDKGFIVFQDPSGGDNNGMRYDAAGSTGGGTNVLKMSVVSTEGNRQLESSNNLQTTEWQHCGLVWSSGEQLKFYVNGMLDSPTANSDATTGITADFQKMIIGKAGKDDGAGEGWDGLIDDVRIYDYALSGAEVGWLAGRTRPFDKPF